MTQVFLKMLNMSISASWVVLAVLVLRLLLKKAPKWLSVTLWGIVGIRLISPFSLESALSLIPSKETISPDIMVDPTPQVKTGITVLNNVINPVTSQSFAPDPQVSANPLQIWIPVKGAISFTRSLVISAELFASIPSMKSYPVQVCSTEPNCSLFLPTIPGSPILRHYPCTIVNPYSAQ